MLMRIGVILILLLFSAGTADADQAKPAVYPVDTASFLAGSLFDFKVEFPAVMTEKEAGIRINGRRPEEVFGKKGEFVVQEGNFPSALWVRQVSLAPGEYAVTAEDGTALAHWNVYGTDAKAPAKNVIILIADGMSVGHRTAARQLSLGVTNGKYNGSLSMDNLPHTATVGICSVDSIATDSANAASAFMTGHKTSVNALGVYADRTKNPFDDPRQETMGELIRRTTKKSLGIVTDAEIVDATPAAVYAHCRLRMRKDSFVPMLMDLKPEVILGGGSAYFKPQSQPGSKRKDDRDCMAELKQLGYTQVSTRTELKEALAHNPEHLLGLFNSGNMDGALDRLQLKKGTVPQFPDQPDLTDSMEAALQVLSANPNGFFLLVEAALIDKYSHSLDWERSVYDTIMFDKVVAQAQKFCDEHPDTLLIVTPDHTHAFSVIGTVDDSINAEHKRDKVMYYGLAGYPGYKDRNRDGYPDTVNPNKRLAAFFADFPDYYETYGPKMDGPFVPSSFDGSVFRANEKYNVPGAQLRRGNLPRVVDGDVHPVDDIITSGRGPHSEDLHGFLQNSDIFGIMAKAMGLGSL